MRPGTGTVPGNLTGIGDGRATPLPKTRTRRTVKTPAPRPAPQSAAQQSAMNVLNQAVGNTTVDLANDFNGDGRVTSADALAKLKADTLAASTTPAPSGDFQSNVDFMNQMATQNAQVGSDGQAVMPSFSYDPATNEYVRDSSAFGLTGDAAITRYSPEEFQQEFGRTLAKQGTPAPAPAPKPPRSGPKPRVISDPVKPKRRAAPRGKITDRRTRGRGRGR